ncbi:MAG: hypothetical protein RIA71_05360 [Oceanicaulis sp.]
MAIQSLAQVVALSLAATPGVETAPDRGAAATRFHPESLQVDGRLTLTPGFSPDGRTMYFAQTECLPIWECPQRLKRSDRTADGWSTPVLVELPVDSRVDYPSVTPDGERLLFSWMVTHPEKRTPDSDGNFDLWSLDLFDPDAGPVPLRGPDLNRVRAGAVRTLRFVNNETAPTLTTDGDLYFWSERLEGVGDRDVYVARSDGAGGFNEPELLPAPINSTGPDDGASVSPDGRTMFITYRDRGGCGGSDVFVSYQEAGVWSAPENLGCEINSPDEDFAASLIPGTRQIVFPSNRPVEGATPGTFALWTATLPLR